jgi:hypothetical protein
MMSPLQRGLIPRVNLVDGSQSSSWDTCSLQTTEDLGRGKRGESAFEDPDDVGTPFDSLPIRPEPFQVG